MNKKAIVLADNSYTIRRIVELSFSEEEEIDLISVEDGQNLKEKLLETKPAVVMVDIKLPEFNGYDVCKFINGAESLQHTKVFLMKGGFEPIDESLLTNLKFEDIITKPFDSNALVASIKKILAQSPRQTPPSMPEEVPASAPEFLPEIEPLPAPSPGGMNFPDIDDEFGSEGILSDNSGHDTMQFSEEDVLPSEEITQGAQPERDSILPEMVEDIDNPFRDDGAFSDFSTSKEKAEIEMKSNIRDQEKDLEIDSLTQEEININKQIQERGLHKTPSPLDHGIDSETAELLSSPSTLDTPIPPPPQYNDDPETSEMFKNTNNLDSPIPGNVEPMEEDFPDVKVEDIESPLQFAEIPEVNDIEMGYKKEITSNLDKKDNLLEIPQMPTTQPSQPIIPTGVEEVLGQERIDFEKEVAADPGIMETVPIINQEEGNPFQETLPEIQTPLPPPIEHAKAPAPPIVEPPIVVPPIAEPTPQPPVQEAPTITTPYPEIPREELISKVEEKLAIAIKEILWEIVPPVAEKIVKEEIEKLKLEVEKSLN